MIEPSDRESLINYRLEQAKETIELSNFLLKADKLTVSVNRIYYGMYYAVTALALKYSFETSKHAQLLGWFNKEFVATGIVEKRLGKSLRIAFQNRTKGDYDAYVTFEKEEVEQMQIDLIEFVEKIERIITPTPNTRL